MSTVIVTHLLIALTLLSHPRNTLVRLQAPVRWIAGLLTDSREFFILHPQVRSNCTLAIASPWEPLIACVTGLLPPSSRLASIFGLREVLSLCTLIDPIASTIQRFCMAGGWSGHRRISAGFQVTGVHREEQRTPREPISLAHSTVTSLN